MTTGQYRRCYQSVLEVCEWWLVLSLGTDFICKRCLKQRLSVGIQTCKWSLPMVMETRT